ncbi:MAG: DUF4760 domain-containing protein [Ruminococcus flavefaciens]|nr:DUF4760 domain-containing protein [Ruminococcus flavefaciens]
MKNNKITCICSVIQTIALILILILHCFNLSFTLPEKFFSEITWVAIGSIGTLLSVIIAVVSTIMSNQNKKKQATFEAMKQLKQNPYENIIHGYTMEKVNSIIRSHKENSDNKDLIEEWNNIKEYLVFMEQFAVCANNSVFDLKTINRMGGPFLIEMYNVLKPIIEYKRIESNRITIYEEFEKLINNLKRIGAKK